MRRVFRYILISDMDTLCRANNVGSNTTTGQGVYLFGKLKIEQLVKNFRCTHNRSMDEKNPQIQRRIWRRGRVTEAVTQDFESESQLRGCYK